jgi:hypothetical protein
MDMVILGERFTIALADYSAFVYAHYGVGQVRTSSKPMRSAIVTTRADAGRMLERIREIQKKEFEYEMSLVTAHGPSALPYGFEEKAKMKSRQEFRLVSIRTTPVDSLL